jgi:hypothetical protein
MCRSQRAERLQVLNRENEHRRDPDFDRAARYFRITGRGFCHGSLWMASLSEEDVPEILAYCDGSDFHGQASERLSPVTKNGPPLWRGLVCQRRKKSSLTAGVFRVWISSGQNIVWVIWRVVQMYHYVSLTVTVHVTHERAMLVN